MKAIMINEKEVYKFWKMLKPYISISFKRFKEKTLNGKFIFYGKRVIVCKYYMGEIN